MKRIHISITASDIPSSVRFYTTLFGVPPTVQKEDYAKWMLDDPRVNLSVSTGDGGPGVDHLGIQTETADELGTLAGRLKLAGANHVDQAGADCCYARSDKTWVYDPEGRRVGDLPHHRHDHTLRRGPCAREPVRAGPRRERPRRGSRDPGMIASDPRGEDGFGPKMDGHALMEPAGRTLSGCTSAYGRKEP